VLFDAQVELGEREIPEFAGGVDGRALEVCSAATRTNQ
jgi:hypothetical protein